MTHTTFQQLQSHLKSSTSTSQSRRKYYSRIRLFDMARRNPAVERFKSSIPAHFMLFCSVELLFMRFLRFSFLQQLTQIGLQNQFCSLSASVLTQVGYIAFGVLYKTSVYKFIGIQLDGLLMHADLQVYNWIVYESLT